jgi:gliding motility-associated-like protein
MKSKFLLAAIFLLLGLQAYAVTPTITSFSPQSGAVGTLITITGSNLAGATTVSIGGVSGLVVSKSGPQVVAYVMPGTVTGPVALTTPGGTTNSAGNFTVTPTPFPTAQEGNPLIPTTNYNGPQLGLAVAISADGSTAIIGGYPYFTGTGFNPGLALAFAYNNGAWVQQGVLIDFAVSGGQGRSVALSADGNTAMIGAASYASNPAANSTGAVWFYTRSSGTWTAQGPLMIGTGGTGFNQGFSCALSADGNTAVEADLSDNNNVGSAWAFTRNAAGVWSQLGAKFGPSDNAGIAFFGIAMALSADGNTVVIGGNADNTNVIDNQQHVPGATWVFTRSGTTWKQQGSKLVATGGTANDTQGSAVAISADGNTLATSGPGSNSVWVFTRTGGTWSQLGSRLAPTGITGNPGNNIQQGFGDGLSMSADGNTLMVGDPLNGSFDGPGPGGTWIFARSGNTYIQQEADLFGTGTGTTANPGQGTAVALSANGAVGIAGGPNNNSFQGGGWAFSAVLQTQTITFAAPANAIYGSADASPGATSDNSTISITYTSSNPAVATITPAGLIHITGAGNTTITAMQAGNSIYSPAMSVPQPFTVTPAPLTVTAANKSKNVGTPNPIFTATFSGFVNGDTQTSLTQQPTVTTTATTTSPAGDYPILASDAIDPNYTFTYVPGTLKVVSTNAYLNSIALTPNTPLTVVPGPGYKNYTTTEFTANISVTAVTVDPLSTITVNGMPATSGTPFALTLTPGSNTLTVEVTAEDDMTHNSYIITVTRELSNNDLLTAIGLTPNVTLTPVAGPGFKNYAVTVGNAISSVTETAVTSDPAAMLAVNGNTANSGTPTGALPLMVGNTTITTVVTAENGATNNYIITVTRKPSSVNTLSALTLSAGALSPAFASGTNTYTAQVGNGTTVINLTPTLTDLTASVTVNGIPTTSGNPIGVSVFVGANNIPIQVTAQDGTVNNYSVNVTRAPSSNALLSSIGLHPFETLTTVAGPGYKNYTATVSSATGSISVVPTASDPTAKITVDGTTVNSGTGSGPITLDVGSTTINTIVTAQDGTMKTYIITVTRPGPGNIHDAAIGVEQAANSPQFTEDNVVVHQGLSPNGDGINDFLTIDGIAAYPDNKITIMNRNGALVFEEKGYDNSSKVFDGHSNKTGVMQLPGTYFYSLDYAVKGITRHKTGFIVLKY